MRTHPLPAVLLLAGLLLSPDPASGRQQADSTAAVTAALEWVALVDGGRYAESLDAAAPLLRQMAGSAAAWESFVTMARDRYPASGERRVASWEPDFRPDGAPSGRYARVVLEPLGVPSTHESVVLTLADGFWRVAMYGVRGSAEAGG